MSRNFTTAAAHDEGKTFARAPSHTAPIARSAAALNMNVSLLILCAVVSVCPQRERETERESGGVCVREREGVALRVHRKLLHIPAINLPRRTVPGFARMPY